MNSSFPPSGRPVEWARTHAGLQNLSTSNAPPHHISRQVWLVKRASVFTPSMDWSIRLRWHFLLGDSCPQSNRSAACHHLVQTWSFPALAGCKRFDNVVILCRRMNEELQAAMLVRTPSRSGKSVYGTNVTSKKRQVVHSVSFSVKNTLFVTVFVCRKQRYCDLITFLRQSGTPDWLDGCLRSLCDH